MNLIRRHVGQLPLMQYRMYQMELIPELLGTMLKYLIANGISIDPDDVKIKICESDNSKLYKYSGMYYATQLCTIQIEGNKEDFLHVYIPELIDNCFILNGSRYIPMMYLSDAPITFKEKSILLYSLFSSLTIDSKNNRIIYEGVNIPVTRFLRVYFEDAEIPELIPRYTHTIVNETRERSLVLLSTVFNTPPDWEQLRRKMNLLFFDDWTGGLYQSMYGFDTLDLKEVFEYVGEYYNKSSDDDFINLNKKRLMFVEQLLTPIFKKTRSMIIDHMQGRLKMMKLKISKPTEIANYFFKDMSGSTLYESVNDYSSLTLFKASFKRPGAGILPACVKSIHRSYKNTVDVVNVSNTNPGQIVNLIPTTNVDLRYGKIYPPNV